jgi:L-amino acid N-acyltransferase YncA
LTAEKGAHVGFGGSVRNIGWKHGQWRDVTWSQLPIGADAGPPAELR